MKTFKEILLEETTFLVHVTGKPSATEKKEIDRLLDYYKGTFHKSTDKGAIFKFTDKVDVKLFAEMINGRSRNIKNLTAEIQ